MRKMNYVFVICLLFATSASAQSSYASYQFESASGEAASYSVTEYTVQAGDTIEGILTRHGVQPSPRAVSSVLEENPTVRDKRAISPGMVIRVPKPTSATELTVFRHERANSEALWVANALEASYGAQSADNRAHPLQAYAIASNDAANESNALSASALREWNLNGALIARLSRSEDEVVRLASYEMADESSNGLLQASALARAGRATRLYIKLQGSNPPKGRVPKTCRIRYSLWGYAYRGRIDESNVRDTAKSNCSDGLAQIEALVSYGFWTEWLEGKQWRRSKAKQVRLDPGSSLTVDLPMQPYD